MKSSDIFVGTIEKCSSAYFYNLYGKERYIGEFIINHREIGSIVSYSKQITDQAILIRVNEDKYIWINHLTNFMDDLLVNLGFSIKVINTSPSCDDELFVVKDSLKPYFNNTQNENLSVNKLRKKVLIDPKIRGGIEN